jgi:hypothetical protein
MNLILVLRVQLEQLGASAVGTPNGLLLQETSDEVSGPVRTGEVLADPARCEAGCTRWKYMR